MWPCTQDEQGSDKRRALLGYTVLFRVLTHTSTFPKHLLSSRISAVQCGAAAAHKAASFLPWS